ncbi:MAG: RHS repeat-associated core domain-containing protein [Bacteroidota bacterium]|nr:RHS repeat-associated core domain-containing protein [Bacteroidota bacterium]MDP4247096.1 RHS repeat-associated core domain-containing protein [Bacteroidota bacterium]MDP4256037.1 RHS repeat-associated core domain-containing protein [Bacteroidota bacterium]MDP4260730.1 RHS repeat-associated core domain-containing protein [Bacteroidota bacterium]
MLTPNVVIPASSPLANDGYPYATATDPVENAGLRQYELTNHLGNVVAVISDNHVNNDGIPNGYQPIQLYGREYFGFGGVMRSLNIAGSGYRYGFNGKENDDEVRGANDEIDYGKRGYDPRIGRFMSVDPLAKRYPYYSAYQFAGNTPIQASDLDGNEPWLRQTIKAVSSARNAITAVSTSGTTEAGLVITLSSGMAVDPKGNVLTFSTNGGLAAAFPGNPGGFATNAALSWTANFSFYNEHLRDLRKLMGVGGNMGVSAGWKEVVVLGRSVEQDEKGNAIGNTYQLGLGFGAIPYGEIGSTKSVTTGLILTGTEYDKVYNDKTTVQHQAEQAAVDYDYAQTQLAGGNIANALFMALPSSIKTDYQSVDGKANAYHIVYNYSLYLYPNGLVNLDGKPAWINKTFDTGVEVQKDEDGNYISTSYRNQGKQ